MQARHKRGALKAGGRFVRTAGPRSDRVGWLPGANSCLDGERLTADGVVGEYARLVVAKSGS
jgi:hypothetical protein